MIVFLICLPRAFKYPYKSRREIEQSPTSSNSPEQVFRSFVSKLAFLCWTDITPAAISACVVLQRFDDTVEYVFAFNQRSALELKELKGKIRSILDMFRHSPSTNDKQKEILRTVLSCCVKRVKGYLRGLERHLDQCIGACAKDNGADGMRPYLT